MEGTLCLWLVGVASLSRCLESKFPCSLLDQGFRFSSNSLCFSDYDAGCEIDARDHYDATSRCLFTRFWNKGWLSSCSISISIWLIPAASVRDHRRAHYHLSESKSLAPYYLVLTSDQLHAVLYVVMKGTARRNGSLREVFRTEIDVLCTRTER